LASRDAAAVAATPKNGNAKFIIFCDARRDAGSSQGAQMGHGNFGGSEKILNFIF
jgi:hypothetical protein